MRVWSLHPVYLDAKGLVALWRETLLALHVLRGQTKGYTRHPQLQRFRLHPDPVAAVQFYLRVVWEEAQRRGYAFDETKIGEGRGVESIPVTSGQLAFEQQHLLEKLRKRAPDKVEQLMAKSLLCHPLFALMEGEVENWEKLSGL
jgi:hypothetical protein